MDITTALGGGFSRKNKMKKKYKQIIGLYLIGLVFCTNSIGQLQHEGLLNYITNYPIDISTTKEYPIEKKENKIWFLDSCIIWEQRINYVTEEPADTGRIQKYSYPVSRYVYFDLRTKHCQDYISLKDTAMPFCNYSLKDSDHSPFYGFFFPMNYIYPLDTLDVITDMTDTTISNAVFKRVSRLRKTPLEGYIRSTFYLNCSMPRTIFQFGSFVKNIEAMYAGCQIVKSELIFDSSGIKLGGAEYKIIRDKLTKEEKNIFKCWEQNSKKTTLPLLPYSEVMKLIYPSPEHENPIITNVPREK
jgi:hypothetical protein